MVGANLAHQVSKAAISGCASRSQGLHSSVRLVVSSAISTTCFELAPIFRFLVESRHRYRESMRLQPRMALWLCTRKTRQTTVTLRCSLKLVKVATFKSRELHGLYESQRFIDIFAVMFAVTWHWMFFRNKKKWLRLVTFLGTLTPAVQRHQRPRPPHTFRPDRPGPPAAAGGPGWSSMPVAGHREPYARKQPADVRSADSDGIAHSGPRLDLPQPRSG